MQRNEYQSRTTMLPSMPEIKNQVFSASNIKNKRNNMKRLTDTPKTTSQLKYGQYNNNSSHFLKIFEQKLQVQADEIEARNNFISDLQNNIHLIKEEMEVEQENLYQSKMKNQKITEENMKQKQKIKDLKVCQEEDQEKIQELTWKIEELEKQNQQLQNYKDQEGIRRNQKQKTKQIETSLLQRIQNIEAQHKEEIERIQNEHLKKKNDLLESQQMTKNQQQLEIQFAKKQWEKTKQTENINFQNQIENYQKGIRKLNEEMEVYKAKENKQKIEQQDRIKLLTSQLNDQNNEIFTHKNKASDIQLENETLANTLKETLLRLSELEKKLDSNFQNEKISKALNNQQEQFNKIEEKHKVNNKKLSDTIQQLQGQIEERKNEIFNYKAQLEKIKKEKKTKNSQIENTIGKLIKTEKEIQQNLNCSKCKMFLKEPVTVIPCGHSYCFQCKDAYFNNKCFKCGPKFKVEAVYRNELLDDIIIMLQLVQNAESSLKEAL